MFQKALDFLGISLYEQPDVFLLALCDLQVFFCLLGILLYQSLFLCMFGTFGESTPGFLCTPLHITRLFVGFLKGSQRPCLFVRIRYSGIIWVETRIP